MKRNKTFVAFYPGYFCFLIMAGFKAKKSLLVIGAIILFCTLKGILYLAIGTAIVRGLLSL